MPETQTTSVKFSRDKDQVPLMANTPNRKRITKKIDKVIAERVDEAGRKQWARSRRGHTDEAPSAGVLGVLPRVLQREGLRVLSDQSSPAALHEGPYRV